MLFLSIEFVFFLAVLLCVMCFLKGRKQQQWMLLAASYFFYAWNDWRMLLLLAAETAAVYLIECRLGKEQDERKRKLLLTVGVSALLIVLGFFKYFNFFVDSICTVFRIQDSFTLNIILPLGISYYTFQGLSFLFDVYYGKIEAEKDFVKVGLCIGFFPQIIAGPIVKAHDMMGQLEEAKKINWNDIAQGAQIFLTGIFKKKVIADRVGVQVDAVFGVPQVYSAGSLALAAVAYSIQLYCDFSGYSDMAIGIAKMIGFDLGRNFNLPYFAKNTSEFWRRWHISLSTWFRDYVYIPLGGSRKGKVRTCRNLIITMLLSGLWHGASWQFVLWGTIYGVTNAFYKIYSDWCKPYREKWEKVPGKSVRAILAIILNFILVTIIQIFFRAESFSDVWVILKRIFTCADGVEYYYVYTIIYGILLMIYEAWLYLKNGGNYTYMNLNLKKFSGKLVFCIIIWLILCFAYVGSNAFIYAQF